MFHSLRKDNGFFQTSVVVREWNFLLLLLSQPAIGNSLPYLMPLQNTYLELCPDATCLEHTTCRILMCVVCDVRTRAWIFFLRCFLIAATCVTTQKINTTVVLNNWALKGTAESIA